jgi:hypothetical protein
MGRIRDYIARLQLITEQSQEDAILGIIRDNEATAVDLNLKQLFSGKDVHGEPLKPEYSATTVAIKKAKGQPTDRVTLKDEGDFYRSFFMVAQQFPVFFDARDAKTGLLAERYGDLFGLDENSIREFNQDYLKEQLLQYYRELLAP